MALFDDTTNTLEQVLGRQANNTVSGVEDVYAKKRRRAISQEAHSGRLGSGVANYTLGDLDAAEAGEEGDIYSKLAGALGQVPSEDYFGAQDFERKRALAKRIAELQKPSTLEEVFGGIGSGLQIASNIASIGG